MPDPVSAIGAAVSVGGSLIKGGAGKKAARQQAAAIGQGISEIEDTQNELRNIFAPFLEVASPALQEQMTALGLRGPEAESAYVSRISGSPIFQSIAKQGEEAMLQQASATGGLRGGNIQGALAQFRPSLLNQFLTNRFEQLGGLSSGALGATTALGGGLTSTAQSAADLFTQQGAARAGGTLAKGAATSEMLGTLGGFAKGLFK